MDEQNTHAVKQHSHAHDDTLCLFTASGTRTSRGALSYEETQKMFVFLWRAPTRYFFAFEGAGNGCLGGFGHQPAVPDLRCLPPSAMDLKTRTVHQGAIAERMVVTPLERGHRKDLLPSNTPSNRQTVAQQCPTVGGRRPLKSPMVVVPSNWCSCIQLSMEEAVALSEPALGSNGHGFHMMGMGRVKTWSLVPPCSETPFQLGQPLVEFTLGLLCCLASKHLT